MSATDSPEQPLHDLACVVHVHSTFSDGKGTVTEIVEAARDTGADAVLLTDHDSLEARHRGLEGWHGSVLLLVGVEISPRGGHLLAFGPEEEIDHHGRSESEICSIARERGALTFPAHPFSGGSRISRRVGRPHRWPGLDDDEYTGIELWSLLTEAAEACASIAELIAFLRNPQNGLDGPPARNLAEWDRLCRRRRTVAIGGLDAHESGIRLGSRVLSPLRNRKVFRLLRTHVLCDGFPTGRLEDDRKLVYEALAEGRCYLAADVLADPKGFEFWAESGDGRLEMGAEATAGEWIVRARLPLEAELRLMCDGREVERLADATALSHPTRQAGVYRLEARLSDGGRTRSWVISNPIYLRGGRPGATGRARAPGLPTGNPNTRRGFS